MRKELYLLYPDIIESLTYKEVKDRDIVLKEPFFGNVKILNFIRELYLRFPSVQINSLSGRELEDALDILLYQNNLPQISKTYKLIIKDIGCNARCPMCDDWKNKEDAIKLEESMLRAFQEIYDDNVSKKYIQILGGEPLLMYNSIKKILQLSGGAIEFDFPTNASLLNIVRIDELLSLGLRKFTFSLDFPSEKHDSWRNLPGVCDKIVTFTNYLRSRGVEVQWNTVVGKFNIDEISSFQDFYDSVKPSMHNFIYIDGYGGKSSEYLLTDKEIYQTLHILEELENGNKDTMFVRNGFFPGGTGEVINNLRKKNCFAPIKRKSFYITDSGYIETPCYYENKKILDNLQEFTADAIAGKCREKCDTSCGSAYIIYLNEVFEKFQHHAREYEFPEDVMIEVTNVCDLECTTSYSHQDGREKKFMEMSLFRKIIDHLPKKETRTVSLYDHGMILMHPDIIKMVAYAKKSRVACVKISTNGHFLSPKISAGLISAGLDYLSISIDGTTQEVYQKFRKNGNLSMVLKNTLSLIQLKKKTGRGPIVEIQFIIMQHNEHQIPLMRNLAKKIGADMLRLKTVLIKEKGWESLLPQDQKKGCYDKKTSDVCLKPVEGMVINVDGTTIPCCYMTDKWINVHMSGKVQNENLQVIFRNSDAFLKKVTTDKTQIPYCDRCNEGNMVLDYEVMHFHTK